MSGGRKVGGNEYIDSLRKYMPATHSVLENIGLLPSPVGNYATQAHDVNQALVAIGMGKHRKPRVHKMVFHGGMTVSEIYGLLKANKAGIHFVLDTVVPSLVPSQKGHASSLSNVMKMVGLGSHHAHSGMHHAHSGMHHAHSLHHAHSGGKRPPTKHALAVRRVMQEHGMKLGEASKYVKMHGLGK